MLKNLIKIKLLSFLNVSFSKNKNGSTKKSSVALAIVLYLILGLSFGMMALSVAMMMAPVAILMEAEWLYFTLFNMLCFSFVFMFSVFETKSVLFDCKDNELLLSMPINSRDIVLSRLFTVLAINYLETFVIMLPAIIAFACFGGGVTAVIGSSLVTIFIPLAATALSTAVGYLVAKISKRFKNNSALSVTAYLIFFALYFVAYYWLMGGLETLETDPENFILNLSSMLGIAKGIGEASLLKPIPFIAFAVLSALVSVGIFYVIIKNYVHIITKTEKTNKVKYVKQELKAGGITLALAKKEISKFLSSPNYILNAALGSIMQVVIGVILLVRLQDKTAALSVIEMLGFDGLDILLLLCSLGSVMIMSLNMTSASALSLEGNRLWILSSSPIKPVNILMAKLTPHLMVSVPASLITALLISVAAPSGFWNTAFTFLISLSSSLIFAYFGLIMNIMMPKFEFDNEAMVIKQSGAVTVTMLSSMLFGILLVGLGFFLSFVLSVDLAFVIITAVLLLICLALHLILFGPCQKRLCKILKG